MTQLKAILFDHDGTMVASEQTHYLHWCEVLARYDLSLSEDDYKAHLAGVPTIENARYICANMIVPISPEELVSAKAEVSAEFSRTQAFPLMPHVRETIEFCFAAGLKLAVVSASKRSLVNSTLRHHNLTDIFDVISTGDDVKHNKPAPDVYLYALAQLGTTADEAIALEDTKSGLRAAKNAGLRCGVIPDHFSENHDFTGADHRFTHMGEAKQWIARLIS